MLKHATHTEAFSVSQTPLISKNLQGNGSSEFAANKLLEIYVKWHLM